MFRQPKLYIFLVCLTHLFIFLGCEQEEEVFALAGHWEGIVNVSKDSSEVTQVAYMSLIITSESDVLGDIGQTKIQPGATVEKNNFAENDYIINSKVSGSLFGFDSLKNVPVRILVQLKDEKLTGGFSLNTGMNTKKPIMLIGTEMELKRQ